MAQTPQDPEEFTEFFASKIRILRPSLPVQISDTWELIVGAWRLRLSDPFRLVRRDFHRGAEIVENYLSGWLSYLLGRL